MYEIWQEPHERQINRHEAWRTQQHTVDRCLDAQRRLGYEPVFALTTALGLFGVPAPPGIMLDDGPLHMCRGPNMPRRRVPLGLRQHQWRAVTSPGAVTRVFGIRCTTPAATFAHIARYTMFESLIMLADRLSCRDPLLRRATGRELAAFLQRHGGLAARDTAIRALHLSRDGTDSPAETRLRNAALQRGLPMPVVNHEVAVGFEASRFLDMAYPRFGVAMEFNGRHHAVQAERDSTRLNALSARNWRIFQAWGSTLADERALDEYCDDVKRGLEGAGAAGFMRPRMELWELGDRRLHLDVLSSRDTPAG